MTDRTLPAEEKDEPKLIMDLPEVYGRFYGSEIHWHIGRETISDTALRQFRVEGHYMTRGK